MAEENYRIEISRGSLILLAVGVIAVGVAIFLGGLTLGFNMIDGRLAQVEQGLAQRIDALPRATTTAEPAPINTSSTPTEEPLPPPLPARPIAVPVAQWTPPPATEEPPADIDATTDETAPEPPPEVDIATDEPVVESDETAPAEAANEPLTEEVTLIPLAEPLPAPSEPILSDAAAPPPALETPAAEADEAPTEERTAAAPTEEMPESAPTEPTTIEPPPLLREAGDEATATTDQPIYEVQVGLFLRQANARQLHDRLQRAGYAVRLFSKEGSEERIWHAVRIGGFTDPKAAAEAAKRIKETEGLSTLVARRGELS